MQKRFAIWMVSGLAGIFFASFLVYLPVLLAWWGKKFMHADYTGTKPGDAPLGTVIVECSSVMMLAPSLYVFLLDLHGTTVGYRYEMSYESRDDKHLILYFVPNSWPHHMEAGPGGSSKF